MAAMKSPGPEFGACPWGHQANLAAQRAKLDCSVCALALLWLGVTHWQAEQRTRLGWGEGLLAGGGRVTWALLSASHPGGRVGCWSCEGGTGFIFL